MRDVMVMREREQWWVGVVGVEGSDAWDEKMGDWWTGRCGERW